MKRGGNPSRKGRGVPGALCHLVEKSSVTLGGGGGRENALLKPHKRRRSHPLRGERYRGLLVKLGGRKQTKEGRNPK